MYGLKIKPTVTPIHIPNKINPLEKYPDILGSCFEY